MLFWIVILFILYFAALIYKGKSQPLYWLSIMALIFIAGFRDISVGTDTYNYYVTWNTIVYYGTSYMEYGWNMIAILVAFFTDDYNLYLSTISAFTLCTIQYTWSKYSENKQLSLFIYFAIYAYCGSLNIMRQYCAISILLISYTFLYENKKLLCVLFIFIATTIHTAAIFALPVILANKINLSNKTFVILSVVITLILGMLPFVKSISFLAGKFEHFFRADKLYRDSASVYIVLSSMYSVFFLFIYLNATDLLKNNIMFKIFFIGVLIFNAVCQLRLGTRLFYNFAITQTLFIPNLFNANQNFKIKLALTLYLLIYCSIMLIRNTADVYPYINVFDKYF